MQRQSFVCGISLCFPKRRQRTDVSTRDECPLIQRQLATFRLGPTDKVKRVPSCPTLLRHRTPIRCMRSPRSRPRIPVRLANPPFESISIKQGRTVSASLDWNDRKTEIAYASGALFFEDFHPSAWPDALHPDSRRKPRRLRA